MNYFKFREFTRESVIPVYVADIILTDHMPNLNRVRERLGAPITISERSGFRSAPYERSQGRSGTSQHTFRNNDGTPCYGAVDVTTDIINLEALGHFLVELTDYTRVAWYPDSLFYHCDYKESDHRLFMQGDNGWERVTHFNYHSID